MICITKLLDIHNKKRFMYNNMSKLLDMHYKKKGLCATACWTTRCCFFSRNTSSFFLSLVVPTRWIITNGFELRVGMSWASDTNDLGNMFGYVVQTWGARDSDLKLVNHFFTSFSLYVFNLVLVHKCVGPQHKCFGGHDVIEPTDQWLKWHVPESFCIPGAKHLSGMQTIRMRYSTHMVLKRYVYFWMKHWNSEILVFNEQESTQLNLGILFPVYALNTALFHHVFSRTISSLTCFTWWSLCRPR